METEFGKKCWDVRSESGVTEEDVEDDNPSEVIKLHFNRVFY